MSSGTDQYADAAGLVARSAAAYVSSVPTDPADDGFFGPASVTWRVSGDLSSIVAGLRALLVQALHPLAMVSVGDRAAAERAAARVRRIHEHVRGTDPVTGRPYAASDPALLLWVHAVLVESNIVACQLFGTPLTPQDSDRYVAEMAVAAELVGVPAALVPASAGELRQYLSSVQNELRPTPAATDAAAFLLDPPGLDPDIAEIWQDVRDGTVATLPEWAREMYGYRAPGDLTPARRTEIRQALGVLDVVFLGEPGVLEARQRIALRMRTAQRA